MRRAIELGADRIATGHYASVEFRDSDEQGQLKKALDSVKDQSYFLYGIRQECLKSILFPLSSCSKAEARQKTQRLHSYYEGIRESQDICFIPEGDYKAFLNQFVPPKKGEIVSVEGKILGHHEGVHSYTIGQRRGLGVPFSAPLYVIHIEPESNTIVVGARKDLEKSGLEASDINLLAPCEGIPLAGRVRYRQKEQPCTCRLEENRLFVTFDKPVSSITPGQSVVLYDGDRVVGGGVINRAFDCKPQCG